jgi:hypothetical protein
MNAPAWRVNLTITVVLWLLARPVSGSLELAFGVEDIQGEGWLARGITIDLVERAPDSLGAVIRLEELQLPEGYGTVQGLRLECPALVRDGEAWQCADGRLSVRDSPIQGQDASWQGRYQTDGQWQLVIPRLAIAQGSVGLEIGARDGAWSAEVRPNRTAVSGLANLSAAVELPRGWDIKGRTSGSVRISGAAADVSRVAADLVVDQLGYASPDGTQAAEKVVLKVDLVARLRDGAWYFEAGLGWPRGAVYSDPLFVDADQGPVRAKSVGHWHRSQGRLQLDAWSIDLPDTANVSGTGLFRGADLALDDLTIAVQSQDAGSLYRRLLQPFLIGTAADDVAATGQVGLVLHIDSDGIEQAGLQLNGLAFEDNRGRFALGRTDGAVGWDRSREVPVSRLTVAGASIYRIPIGDFDISARFAGERVDLVGPVVVPVLGGAVALDSFSLTGALMAGERPRWEASASVRSVSLEQLTRVLEWPPFNGTVSGRLRDMRYADQLFSVGGGLELDAFDGSIRVDNLNIRDPFGAVPILNADATMRGLNLKALTETFSFGRIEGRLDADMANIRLVAWEPDRFDLHLYTPDKDDSRHRISQRAVENLTELGSGVPAGLSVTFLSVFEEFRYDRIDLKMRLQGDVAELDGLARPDGGYYLVKGAGLPRIDVIGRNRSVAWRDLVERLRQIQVEGAQIR